MDALLSQLSNPAVAAALGFVVGGVFTAVVDFVATEISASHLETRLVNRGLREVRLKALETTQRWALAYTDYVLYAWVNQEKTWNPETYAGARPGLVGDEKTLREYFRAASRMLACDRETEVPDIEDIEELSAAGESLQSRLAEQVDRVAAGHEPLLIPEVVVAEVVSDQSLVGTWFEGFGLTRRAATAPTARQ